MKLLRHWQLPSMHVAPISGEVQVRGQSLVTEHCGASRPPLKQETLAVMAGRRGEGGEREGRKEGGKRKRGIYQYS